ncbi:hypothetical protein Dimus_023677 [Dionaea muscipula]
MASESEEEKKPESEGSAAIVAKGTNTADAVEEEKVVTEIVQEKSVIAAEVEEMEVKEGKEGKEGDQEVKEETEEEVGNGKEKDGEGEEDGDEEDEGKGGNLVEGEGTKNSEKEGMKLGSRKGKRSSSKSSKEGATPSERPTRERKLVERFSVSSPVARSSATKPLAIVKGSGTALKEIPNVAFKLSKRKADDNLQLFHTILFGKKAKVHNLKKDIGRFSGFVWIENEDKQRAKVKEKLDKCVKEKLVDFCDLLNIPINRAILKKEVLSVKILEFLESPHATTDTLLADKEQKGKRRRSRATSSKSTSPKETFDEKSAQKTHVSGKHKTSKVDSEFEMNEGDESLDPKGDSMEEGDSDGAPKVESEHEDVDSKEEEPKEQMESPKRSSKKEISGAKSAKPSRNKKKSTSEQTIEIPANPAKSPNTTYKNPLESSVEHSVVKSSSSKKRKVKGEVQENKPAQLDEKSKTKQQRRKSLAKSTTQGQGKERARKKAKARPSREELFDVVVNILKEVDFNTATLSDILRQLGTHFGVDLMERKAEVKEIITEVINSMSDEEDDDDDEEDDDDDEEEEVQDNNDKDENNDEDDEDNDKDGLWKEKNADDKDDT